MASCVWESKGIPGFLDLRIQKCPWGSFCACLSALLLSHLLNSWLVRGSQNSSLSNPNVKRTSFLKTSKNALEKTLFGDTISLACLVAGVGGTEGW